jgi:ABC-type nickel/cobalt efflux system permease component RcnA
MLNTWPKFLVLVLVACLQCVSPLIHAHTNDVPGHHDTHMIDAEKDVVANVQALDVDHHHGQSIGVAKEHKRDYALLSFDAAILSREISLPQPVSLAPDLLRSFATRYTRFTRPSAQAP